MRFVRTRVILVAVLLAVAKCWAKQLKKEREGLFWFTSLEYGPSLSGNGGMGWQWEHDATVCIASAARDEEIHAGAQFAFSLVPFIQSEP